MSKSGTRTVHEKEYNITFRYQRQTLCFDRKVKGFNQQEAVRSLRESLGVLGKRVVINTIELVPKVKRLAQQELT